MRRLTALVCLCVLCLSAAVAGAVLKAAAAANFDRYAKLTEQRIEAEVAKPGPFLWIDAQPANHRTELQRGLRDGGVIIERLETRDGSKSIDFPDALLHHWIGLVFVPGAHLQDAVALMQDYDRHATIFAPAITSSKLLDRNDQKFHVSLRFYVKKVIGVTMDTENEAQFFKPGPDRAYSRIRSTRVTEIAEAGTPQEHAKPAGDENGFMWRLNTYWRFLERDGGTYIQCESLTLSRDVPFALAWIVRPFVTQLPRESLTFTLEKARATLSKSTVGRH
jgi:hypothetical protein